VGKTNPLNPDLAYAKAIIKRRPEKPDRCKRHGSYNYIDDAKQACKS
jgi:hypothetical protein